MWIQRFAPRYLSEQKHGHQGGHAGDIEPVNLIEQRLVVDQADHEHHAPTPANTQ
jgi:hypothetical protein